MSRSRRNAGTIGQVNSPRPYSKSGVWSIEDAAYNKNPAKLSNKLEYPPVRLDEIVDYDPYYSSVTCHLTNNYADDVMRDKSKYNWNEYYRATSTTRPEASLSFQGPRFPYWATQFQPNAYYNVLDTASQRFGTGNFTIEFWLKLCRNEAVEHYVISKGTLAGRTSGGLGWTIYLTTTHQLGFYDGLTNVSTLNTTALAMDTWYRCTIQRSGTGAGQLSVNINGYNGSTVTGTSAGNFADTGNPLRIGCDRVGTSTTNFAGAITDIRISNTAITDAGTYYTNTPLDMTYANCVFSMSMSTPHHNTIPAKHIQSANVTVAGSATGAIKTQDVWGMDTWNNFGVYPNLHFPKQIGHGTHSVYNLTTSGSFKVHDLWAGPQAGLLRFGLNPFTVECWINPNSNGVSGSGSIAGKGSGNSGSGGLGWNFRLNTAYQLVWDDGPNVLTSGSTGLIYPGGWYHVAAVREGTGASQFKIYINGALVYTGTVATDYSQTDDLRIWASRNDQYLFSGYACGLRISSAAKYTSTFDVSTTSFIDSSMTDNPTDTLLLVGTTGTNRPRPPYNQYLNVGYAGVIGQKKRSNDPAGARSIFPRTGAAFNTIAGGTVNRIVVTEANNVFDFGAWDGGWNSSQGEFSIEFWFRDSLATDAITVRRILLDTRATWADTGISISISGHRKLSVETSGKCVLQDQHNRIEPFVWYHVCVQRVGTWLALYVDGEKIQEVYAVQTISCPANKLVLLASTSNMAMGQNFLGSITDVRICSGLFGPNAPYTGIPYNKGNKNPATIPVPTGPLPLTENTVFLLSAAAGIVMDSSTNDLVTTVGGRSESDFTTGWNVYTSCTGPYPPAPYNADAMVIGDGIGTTSDGGNAFGNAPASTSNKIEFGWMTRLSIPWTIETFWYINQAEPAVAGGQYQFSTCNTLGGEGWSLQILTNGAGTFSWGDIVFQLFTEHNAAVQRLGTTSGTVPNIRPHSWNHIAVVYNPNGTNKLALYTNGKRIAATATAWTKGQKPYTYQELQTTYGSGPVRISRTARYDVDAATYTMPTSNWTLDNYTYYQSMYDGPLLNLQGDVTPSSAGGMISYNTKKFGNSSWKFQNKESTFQERIVLRNGAWNTLGTPTHYADFTVEFWAQWWDAASGGRDFFATYGNSVYHHANNLLIGVTPTGLWQIKYQSSGGTTPSVLQTAASSIVCATTSSGRFDHVAVVRRSGNFYLYVNGQQQGNMILMGDYNTGTGLATNYTLSYNQNMSDCIIGGDFANSANTTGWCGSIQDFRLSKMARYTTLERSNLMVYPSTTTIALPKDLHPIRGGKTSNNSVFLYNSRDNNANVGSIYMCASTSDITPYYYTANNAALALDGNWTIEFFAKRIDYNYQGFGTQAYLGSLNSTGGVYPNNQSWNVVMGNYGYVEGFHFNAQQCNPTNSNYGAYGYTAGNALTPDKTWVHYAITRNAGTIKMYVDGVITATTTSGVPASATISNTTQWFIGSGLYGHISNLRFNKDVLYTNDFTPPNTKLTALANTALLIYPLTSDGGLKDYSNNNIDIYYFDADTTQGTGGDVIVISQDSPFGMNIS